MTPTGTEFRPGAGVLILLLAALGCKGEAKEPTEPTHFSTPTFTGVALAPDGLTIAVGDTLQMKASTIPRATVVWQWSVVPQYAAMITESGLVTAIRPGEAEIYACADVPYRICGTAPLTVR